MRHRLLSGTSLRTLQAGLVWAGISAAAPAWALPQGGTVSGGAAQIMGGNGTLRVSQHTDRAVIDWQSFDIAPGEVTRFQQPSASSAILNRIHDHNPSQLLGSLTANGIVALVNPNGMVFGQGSRIDVGSLIATTVDIPNERFLTGQHLLFGQPGETHAAVVNQGNISVQEGGLAIDAPTQAHPDDLQSYFLREFARPGSNRQSAGILSTFTGMAEPYVSGPIKEIFCTKTNFLPAEFSRKGAIIILDLPLDEYEEIGPTAALTLKYIWQRGILRRQGLKEPGDVPVFLWADESQKFITPADPKFMNECRSSVCATVFLTQNINNYMASFHNNSEALTNSLRKRSPIGSS